MEFLNETLTNWYPVLFLVSSVIALAVWAWASKKKARLDINKVTKLILERRYRNGQISKEEYERQMEVSLKSTLTGLSGFLLVSHFSN